MKSKVHGGPWALKRLATNEVKRGGEQGVGYSGLPMKQRVDLSGEQEMASAAGSHGENRKANRKSKRERKAVAGGVKINTPSEKKQRPAQQGNRRAVGFVFPKLGRFAGLPIIGGEIVGWRRRRGRCRSHVTPAVFDHDTMPIERRHKACTELKEEGITTQDPWGSATTGTCFWRDPDAKSCCICGDEREDEHSELKCPYNYLCPASYVPCRARLTIWNDEAERHYRYYGKRPWRPTRQDKIAARRREFLGRVVRVTNLPASCRHRTGRRLIAGLLAQFGPLRMYHIAMRDDGEGFACVVFERREDVEKAVDGLNCYDVDGHSLRVDWVYPNV